MKQLGMSMVLFVTLIAQGNADSVFEWGHWQSDSNARKQIKAGADPSRVTRAPSAGDDDTNVNLNFSIFPDNPNLSPEGLPRLGTNALTVIPQTSVGGTTGTTTDTGGGDNTRGGGVPSGGLLPPGLIDNPGGATPPGHGGANPGNHGGGNNRGGRN